MNPATRNTLAIIAAAVRAQGTPPQWPHVANELLAHDALFAMDQAGLLDCLALRGAAAQRLCFGDGRFIDTLEFAGASLTAAAAGRIKQHLEQALPARRGVPLTVAIHPPSADGQRRLTFSEPPLTADQRGCHAAMSIAPLPVYSRRLLPLQDRYTCLPDGYAGLLLRAENRPEILTDQLAALAASAGAVSCFAAWDLAQASADCSYPPPELLERKFRDHGLKGGLDAGLERLQQRAAAVGDVIRHPQFARRLRPVVPLPLAEQTLDEPLFMEWAGGCVRELATEMRDALRARQELAHVPYINVFDPPPPPEDGFALGDGR